MYRPNVLILWLLKEIVEGEDYRCIIKQSEITTPPQRKIRSQRHKDCSTFLTLLYRWNSQPTGFIFCFHNLLTGHFFSIGQLRNACCMIHSALMRRNVSATVNKDVLSPSWTGKNEPVRILFTFSNSVRRYSARDTKYVTELTRTWHIALVQ